MNETGVPMMPTLQWESAHGKSVRLKGGKIIHKFEEDLTPGEVLSGVRENVRYSAGASGDAAFSFLVMPDEQQAKTPYCAIG